MDDWEKYRCNPLIIPLAGAFGHEPLTTMNECMFMNYSAASPSLFGPLVNVMGSFSDTLSSAGGMMGDMDFVLGGVENMFGSGFSNILSQIGNTASVVQYFITKIEVIFQRVAASLVAIVYSLSSLLQGMVAIKSDKAVMNAVDAIINFPSV
jgi:hypothetical protein